jgi:hypothetical protein
MQMDAQSRPWVLFTAGCPGAGKSTIIEFMDRTGILNLDQFVVADPDAIRYRLPEWPDFVAADPSTAGTRTQGEAGLIAEIIQAEAFRLSRSVLIDGTLRNVDWNSQVIHKLRDEHPTHSIAITLVTAPLDVVLRRIEERQATTSRGLPRAFIDECFTQVNELVPAICAVVSSVVENFTCFVSLLQCPASFAALSQLADLAFAVSNDADDKPPTLQPPPATWEEVRDAFAAPFPGFSVIDAVTPASPATHADLPPPPAETPMLSRWSSAPGRPLLHAHLEEGMETVLSASRQRQRLRAHCAEWGFAKSTRSLLPTALRGAATTGITPVGLHSAVSAPSTAGGSGSCAEPQGASAPSPTEGSGSSAASASRAFHSC